MVRKKNENGFALVGVLVLIMMFLIFVTSLFSTAKFRNQVTLRQIQKKEAVYAANVALELMVKAILSGECDLEENGLEKSDTLLVFEPEDGSRTVEVPVTVWADREANTLVVYAEAKSGDVKKRVSATLNVRNTVFSVATPSSPTPSSPTPSSPTPATGSNTRLEVSPELDCNWSIMEIKR